MPKRSYAKPPQRRIVRRDPEKPDWEGKGCLIISMRDLSLKEDADVWAEMAKVTFQVHNPVDNVILRQEGAVELTDVSTQAELIPSVGDIGFSTGGSFRRRRRESPEMAPSPLVEAPSVEFSAGGGCHQGRRGPEKVSTPLAKAPRLRSP